MLDLDLTRLYLRDQDEPRRFSNEDLSQLLEQAGTVQGAASLGWLLTAADSRSDPVTQSVGNTSESWGQATEQYKIAMAMYEYWQKKDKELNGDDSFSIGLWWEVVPADDGGIVGHLFARREEIEALTGSS